MQLFYISGIQGDTCLLGEEESWHSVKVLRLKEGDPVDLTDGAGWFYKGMMMKVHAKQCIVEITERSFHPRNNYHLHIAIAPTKNIDRFEWFLEKATEIGIAEITPLICEHSERDVLKLPRLEKVLVSAMKQSLKAWLPRLNEPVKFKNLVSEDLSGQKMIAYCETGREAAFHKLYQPGSDVTVLIGPEGDFSGNEVEKAISNGFVPVNLGNSRLRTETAGIVACHTVVLLNEIGAKSIT